MTFTTQAHEVSRDEIVGRGVITAAAPFREVRALLDRPPSGVNEPLLREVVTYMKLHPETWSQEKWAHRTDCGTTHCFAGWTVTLATGLEWTEFDLSLHQVNVPATAAKFLGLGLEEAGSLFYFTGVVDTDSDGEFTLRRPTFEEFVAKVTEVTGVKFKDGEDTCP